MIALCHSELSEALEEYRKNPNPHYTYFSPEGKPEGMPYEMADAAIRILDWFGSVGLEAETFMKAKHEYNKSRAYRHGGKTI